MWVGRMRWACWMIIWAFKQIGTNLGCSMRQGFSKSKKGWTYELFHISITLQDLFLSKTQFRIFAEGFTFQMCFPKVDEILMMVSIDYSSDISNTSFTSLSRKKFKKGQVI